MQENHPQVVEYLLQHGMHPNVADKEGKCRIALAETAYTHLLVGKTPMHIAAAEGNIDMVSTLVASGGDVSILRYSNIARQLRSLLLSFLLIVYYL